MLNKLNYIGCIFVPVKNPFFFWFGSDKTDFSGTVFFNPSDYLFLVLNVVHYVDLSFGVCLLIS